MRTLILSALTGVAIGLGCTTVTMNDAVAQSSKKWSGCPEGGYVGNVWCCKVQSKQCKMRANAANTAK